MFRVRLFTSIVLIYVLIFLLSAPLFTNAAASTNRLRKPATTSQSQPVAHKSGEILVKFVGGISQADRLVLMASHGLGPKKQLRGNSGTEKLEVLNGQNPAEVALQLRAAPQVEFAEPNFNTGNYGSYSDVVNERANNQYVFRGIQDGWQRLNQLGNNGSEYCERARYIMDALNYIFDQGHGPAPGLRFWRGVGQPGLPGGRRAFRQGDIRAANTDFMSLNPDLREYDRLPYWTVNGWRVPRRR